MPAINYRNQARANVANAKAELATGEDHRLRYAALELRFAMEALTYDRAKGFKDELPPSEFETWQPKKLLLTLLEIDPTADKDSTLDVGAEEEFGVEAPVMSSFGTETVLNLGLLKKHYDAMGNYLHVPTLRQAENSPPSPAKLRQRCADVVDYLEKVLASPVWNVNFGHFASFECHLCRTKIRKRFPPGKEKVTAECFGCPATYAVTDMGEGSFNSELELQDVPCGNRECGQHVRTLLKNLKTGTSWTCQSCSGKNVLVLTVRHEPTVEAIDAAS